MNNHLALKSNTCLSVKVKRVKARSKVHFGAHAAYICSNSSLLSSFRAPIPQKYLNISFCGIAFHVYGKTWSPCT